MVITLPVRAISQNKYYAGLGNRKVISGAGRAFIEELDLHIDTYRTSLDIFKQIISNSDNDLMMCIYYYYTNLRTKQGKINCLVPDPDNPNKIIQDYIFKQMGLDDRILGAPFSYRPENAVEDKIVITFMPIPENLMTPF